MSAAIVTRRSPWRSTGRYRRYHSQKARKEFHSGRPGPGTHREARGCFTEKHDRQESVSHTSLFSISIAARSWESLAEQAEQKLM